MRGIPLIFSSNYGTETLSSYNAQGMLQGQRTDVSDQPFVLNGTLYVFDQTGFAAVNPDTGKDLGE